MREMRIREIDSTCFHVETIDFRDNINYHWDQTTQKFYAEYQTATLTHRRFQREYFDFKQFPTIGDAINHIIKSEHEKCNAQWQALVASQRPRVVDRIIV